ncbi:MAG: hypothetical protein K2X32_06865 [Phycisphaerales bacterium]|nr:hypothetical protein [Phycisphaerales bacterium]
MPLSPLLDLTAEAAPPMVADMTVLTGLATQFSAELAAWRLLRVFDAPPAGTEYQITGVTYNLYPGQSGTAIDLWGAGTSPNEWGFFPGNVLGLKPFNTWVVVGKNLDRVIGADPSRVQAVRHPCGLPGIAVPTVGSVPSLASRVGPELISAQPIPEGDLMGSSVREVRYKDSLSPDVVRVREGERLCVAMVFSPELANTLVGAINGCLSVQIHHRVGQPTQNINR